MGHFTKKCCEHNLEITPQWVAIFDVIAQSKDHPSADVVYRRVRETFSNISFDTVNRTLMTFSKIGTVYDVTDSFLWKKGQSPRHTPCGKGSHR